MASFTFGSFGDIITLTQIAFKLYEAIDSSGSIAQHISVASEDINTFLSVCESIDRMMHGGIDISEKDKQVIYNFRKYMLDFQGYLDRFNDSRQMIRIKHRLQFSLSKNNKVSQFESRMRDYGTILGLIQAKYSSLDLKAHVTKSLEPWDQKPMEFQDALGRRYPIPLEVCSSYDGLLSFLEFAFKLYPSTHAAVQNGRFWLFMPKLGGSRDWYIIHEGDWKSIARPGARLGMSFNGVGLHQSNQDSAHKTDNTLTHKSKSESLTWYEEEDTGAEIHHSMDEIMKNLEFQKPLPPWASYHPRTKFELLSPIRARPFPSSIYPQELTRFRKWKGIFDDLPDISCVCLESACVAAMSRIIPQTIPRTKDQRVEEWLLYRQRRDSQTKTHSTIEGQDGEYKGIIQRQRHVMDDNEGGPESSCT